MLVAEVKQESGFVKTLGHFFMGLRNLTVQNLATSLENLYYIPEQIIL